jgi:hypothetical protein
MNPRINMLYATRGDAQFSHWNTEFSFLAILMMMVCALIYLIPIIIAVKKNSGKLTDIILLNIFTGWTLVGWVLALVLAMQDNKKCCCTQCDCREGKCSDEKKHHKKDENETHE